MVKRKSGKRRTSEPTMGPRPTERLLRMLEAGNFESTEEMNGFLQENVVGKSHVPLQPRSDLDRAQDVIYQAYEARSKTQAMKLVRKALAISPDCMVSGRIHAV